MPQLASLKPGKCAVTHSWCLALVEVYRRSTGDHARSHNCATCIPAGNHQARQEKSNRPGLSFPDPGRWRTRFARLPSAAQTLLTESLSSLSLPGPLCQVVSVRGTCLPNWIIEDFNGFFFSRSVSISSIGH